ncbi:MAG: hypothetical protein KAR42_16845 [candidate division Zixibacteria bacterium]|nr:hypothetical protein [candidate division Zixibacteria bacterium]
MRTYFSIITKGIGPFSRVICKGIGPVHKRKIFTAVNVEAYLDPVKEKLIAELPE